MHLMKFFDRRVILLTVSAILVTSFSGTTVGNAAIVSFPGVRPFKLFVPTTYNSSKPAPLILALPGYRWSGDRFEKYLKLTAVAQARGILYVHPDGTVDKLGNQFWNATPTCCDFYGTKVNDEAYLMSIIDDVSKKYRVDPKRIYIIGHSNGGFMAHHMACTHADRIAAVVSFAGVTFPDPAACRPIAPISVLEIWGTADDSLSSNGGLNLHNLEPGPKQTIASWAGLDQCSKSMVTLPQKLDLESQLKGKETTVGQYRGCAAKTAVELWTIVGGHHLPSLSPTFAATVVDFLLAHPKVK